MEDKQTQKHHLQLVEKHTGFRPEALNTPPMPDELMYLWNWFFDLDGTRASYGFGLSPISYTEIMSWSTLTRNYLQAWEVSVLKRLDSVRIQVANEKGFPPD